MKAIGITCGIGSMLVGARAAGFKIAGNVEWRKYYHATDDDGKNTFTENFRGALFPNRLEDMSESDLEKFFGADLALGHPECGNFSQLNSNKSALMDPADIPLFVDIVAKLKPRFFVMDDLPKSFLAFPMEEYARRLPDYDLFPEWVSNWGYGNVQKKRNRMFMIGSLRDERWAFVPGEQAHQLVVSDILGDLGEPRKRGNIPNHDVHALDVPCAKGLHLRYHGHKATWREMQDYIQNEVKEGGPILYHKSDGSVSLRVGSWKGYWDGPSHVLTGGISGFHSLRGLPYSIRERARLQGFPDDFIFYGTRLDSNGEWSHDSNMHMVKQTGKAMPIQFCEYVSRQVAAHIRKKRFPATNTRVLPSNEYVTRAKQEYCAAHAYSNQEAACGSCWLRDACEIRERRLQTELNI